MDELNREEIIEENITEDVTFEEPVAEEVTAAAGGSDKDADAGKKKGRGNVWKYVGAFAAGFAACLGAFAVVMYVAHLGRIIPEADYEFYDDLSNKYGKHYVIMEMIEQDPLVDKVPEAVSEDSLKELVKGLGDPYAEYYTAEEYAEYKSRYEGNYSGIGILVGATDDGLRVEQVYDGSPAAGAGMKAGDIIIKVDGVKPDGLDDAVSRMRGEEGTPVTVTVVRDGKELDLKMKRASIKYDSVGYTVSEEDPEVGYIVVTMFSAETGDDFKNAVEELQDEGCNKFILDLRSNGGGLTDVSIDMADYLLPECRIMTEITKDGKETVYDSEKSSADLDLVVLVDENTASASEILTAAIKENDAGTIIGTKTYGKGVTQISREFKDGSAIKLTVSEYLTPDGNHVQGEGIKPDIEATDEDILVKALEELEK